MVNVFFVLAFRVFQRRTPCSFRFVLLFLPSSFSSCLAQAGQLACLSRRHAPTLLHLLETCYFNSGSNVDTHTPPPVLFPDQVKSGIGFHTGQYVPLQELVFRFSDVGCHLPLIQVLPRSATHSASAASSFCLQFFSSRIF